MANSSVVGIYQKWKSSSIYDGLPCRAANEVKITHVSEIALCLISEAEADCQLIGMLLNPGFANACFHINLSHLNGHNSFHSVMIR
jgi:hypothetical protein